MTVVPPPNPNPNEKPMNASLKVDWTVRFYDLVIIIGAIIVAVANYFSTKADISHLQTVQEAYHQEFLTAEINRDRLDALVNQESKDSLDRIEAELKEYHHDVIQNRHEVEHNSSGKPSTTTAAAELNRHQGN